MPTTGAPGNIWYPDDTAPVAPLENLFLQQATSVNVALAALNGIIVVTNLAALDAISTAKVGDLALMTTPGTGIEPLYWYAFGGSGTGLDWRPLDKVIAATKANLDSFITAVAAIADTRFHVGELAYVTATRRSYRFWSAAGALIPAEASTLIKPTVGGSGVTVADDGLVTFAAASAIQLNGLAGFRKVKVEIEVTAASTNNQLIPRVRSVSTDDTTANYYWEAVVANVSSVAAVPSGGGITGWSGIAPATAQAYGIILELEDLDVARPTRALLDVQTFSGGTQPKKLFGSAFHNVATAWDGISLTTDTGTATGTIRVTGLV